MTPHTKTALILPVLTLASCFAAKPGTEVETDEDTAGTSASSSATSDGALDSMPSTDPSSADSTAGDDGDSADTTSSTTDPPSEDEGTTGPPPCTSIGPAGMPGVNADTIWIANTSANTLSKIDTVSMIELARYETYDSSPQLGTEEMGTSPSAVSVNLDGDVVVANIDGDLVKFYGDVADCPDTNMKDGFQTSSGQEPLPWDDEDCRQWHRSFPNWDHLHAVAWTAGTFDDAACEHTGQKIWAAGMDLTTHELEVALVDGESGSPDWPDVEGAPKGELSTGLALDPAAPALRSGIVDAEDNLWLLLDEGSGGLLVRVDRRTLEVSTKPLPLPGLSLAYGPSHDIFICGETQVDRFDPHSDQLLSAIFKSASGGCLEDDQGRLWVASDEITAIDIASWSSGDDFPVPEALHGLAYDFNGMLWGISDDLGLDNVYRFHPDMGGFEFIADLPGPSNPSDMTGFTLASIAR